LSELRGKPTRGDSIRQGNSEVWDGEEEDVYVGGQIESKVMLCSLYIAPEVGGDNPLSCRLVLSNLINLSNTLRGYDPECTVLIGGGFNTSGRWGVIREWMEERMWMLERRLRLPLVLCFIQMRESIHYLSWLWGLT
jgi:hypothetical protein